MVQMDTLNITVKKRAQVSTCNMKDLVLVSLQEERKGNEGKVHERKKNSMLRRKDKRYVYISPSKAEHLFARIPRKIFSKWILCPFFLCSETYTCRWLRNNTTLIGKDTRMTD